MKYKKKKLIQIMNVIEHQKEVNPEKYLEKKKNDIIEDLYIVESLKLLSAFVMCYSIFPKKVNNLFNV